MAIVDATGSPFKVGNDMPSPYTAGGNGRRTRGWLAPGNGPNDSVTGNAQSLRNRSRQQYRNNGTARSIINRLVSNLVGTGIKPRSLAENKSFQRKAQDLWDVWGKESDPEGALGIYGQQAQAVNCWLQAGECFIRRRDRREADGLSVPMQVQVMEPELCPVHYNTMNGGNPVRAGIEYNRLGQRVAYWMYKSHPGDMALLNADSTQLRRVPADQIIHLYDPIRPGQSRGVPHLSAVLMRMHDVDDYDDATLMRQKIANLFAGFITSPAAGETGLGNLANSQGEEGEDAPEVGLESGLMQELGEGEDVKFSDPPDAGSTYSEFLTWQYRMATAGSDMPYEIATGDYSNLNDRTARFMFLQFKRFVQQKQEHLISHQFGHRLWSDWWVPRAVLSGALTAQGYANNPRKYTKVQQVPQRFEHLHPLQDAQAAEKWMRLGVRTRGQTVAENNNLDIETFNEQAAAENEQADELGLVFDSDPRKRDASGKVVGSPESNNEVVEDGPTNPDSESAG